MLSDDKKIGVQAILEQLEEIFIFWFGGGGWGVGRDGKMI